MPKTARSAPIARREPAARPARAGVRAAARIFCCGGAVIDRCFSAPAPLVPGTSNPARGRLGFGGVARNVAENLARLGVPSGLLTLVGRDADGDALLHHLGALGVDTRAVLRDGAHATGQYTAILGPDGELALAVADMEIFDLIGPEALTRALPSLAAARWVFAESNLPAATLASLAARPGGATYRLAVDAVSVHKATRLPRDLSGIDLVFANADEATAYLSAAHGIAPEGPEAVAWSLRAAGARAVVLTRGADGALVAQGRRLHRIPALAARPVDATGAGDALIAAVLWRMLGGAALIAAARSGVAAAAMTTESEASVRPDLSPRLVALAERRGARSRRARIAR
jgi:pseudouridine kinase